MRSLIVALLAVYCPASPLWADDADVLRRLRPTVRAVAKSAERAGHSRVLVVVREMEGSDSGPADATVIPAVRQAVVGLLEGEKLVVVEAAKAKAQLGPNSGQKLVDSDVVASLPQDEAFDAVVTVDYSHKGRRTTVRVALIDEERKRYVRVVRLADAPADKTPLPKKPLQTAYPLGPPATGPVIPASWIPPLSQGPSGYLKEGSGTGAVPATQNGTQSDGGQNSQPGEQSENTSENTEPGGEQGKPSALNQRIVRFALDNLGKQVGNGECWTLAAEALKTAGAQPPRMYDFGQEINLAQIQPGDVLQFKSARFDLPGGGYLLMGLPQHTAVVYASDGSQVYVLHQNFGKKIVTVLGVRFANMTSGSVQAYRPLPGGR